MSLDEIIARSHVNNGGVWVSREFNRVAELIDECWNGMLELAWIPPDARGPGDLFPYAVIENTKSLGKQIVMYLTEQEINAGLITRLFNMTGRNIIEDLDNAEAARVMMEAAEKRERYEELHDKAKFLWKTPLHNPKMDGVTYDL